MSLERPNLRRLELSPLTNPLAEPATVTMGHLSVFAGRGQSALDPASGDTPSASVIRCSEECSAPEFRAALLEGIKASFDLSRTAFRVFQVIWETYLREKMGGGYADCVRLFWFEGGLNGVSIGMSEKTFQRGLKELLAKRFLSPRTNELFWVNPALFFKGDRIAFVREYKKCTPPKAAAPDPRQPDPRQMDIEDFIR